MIGRWFENKPVLPTIEHNLRGFAHGGHLVAPAHDIERHERRELPREVVVGVFAFGRLVRYDQYLANDIFARKGGRLLMIRRHWTFAGTWPEDSFLQP